MGDGNGAALANLAFHQRDDASVAAEHVAEANSHALHARLFAVALDQHFGDALGCAHHVRRVDGLIRRELHEALHAVRAGGFKQIARAEHVVFDGLGRAELHQRHMLVRRRVENDLRVIQVKDLVEAMLVANRADQRDNRAILAIALAQIVHQLIRAVFVNLKDNQQLRLEPHDLAADFRTDGAAAARHHDDLAGKITRDGIGIQLHLLAGEEVGDVQLADERGRFTGALIRVRRLGEDARVAVRLVAQLEDFLHALARPQRRNGDDDLPNPVAGDELGDILRRAANRHVLNPQPLLVARVVHQNDRLAQLARVFVADVDGIRARLARADDHHRHGVVEAAGNAILRAHAPDHPAAADGNRRHQRNQNQHAAEKPQRQKLVQRQRHAAGNRAQQAEPRHIANARVAPHDLINAAEHVAGHVYRNHQRHRGKHRLRVPRRDIHFKAQFHAQVYGKQNQHNIQQRHAHLAEPCVVFQLIHSLSLSNKSAQKRRADSPSLADCRL